MELVKVAFLLTLFVSLVFATEEVKRARLEVSLRYSISKCMHVISSFRHRPVVDDD